MIKNKYINEGIGETTSGFKDFDEYVHSNHAEQMIFFHGCDKDAAYESFINGNGAQTWLEYNGKNGNCFGRGLYGMLAPVWSGYGNCCLGFLIKKGIPDYFLFFTKSLKEKYNRYVSPRYQNEDFKQTILRLMPDYGIDNYTLNGWNEAWLRGGNLDGVFRNYVGDSDRYAINNKKNHLKKLDQTSVLGYVFYYGYGKGSEALVVRSFDYITPYKIWLPNEKDMKGHDLILHKGEYCFNEGNKENFENVNNTIDFYNRSVKEYPDTDFNGKLIANFGFVKKGDKCNYLNAHTEKYVSPVDFDFGSPFDPALGRCKCGWDLGKTKMEIMIFSSNYGKDVSFKIENNGKYRGISPQDFLTLAGRVKQLKQQRGLLQEAFFTDKNKEGLFSDLRSDTINRKNKDYEPNYVYLYSCTFRDKVDSIMKNGQNREFLGTTNDSSLYYGLGVSASYNFSGAQSNLGSTYGDVIIKYALKNGFKGFLLFDNNMRQKYDNGKTVYQEMLETIPKDVLQDVDEALERKGGRYNSLKAYDYSCHDWNHGGGGPAKAFFEALKGKHVGYTNPSQQKGEYSDEILLCRSKVRGFVFNGGFNPYTAIVRDYGSLIPVAYSKDRGNTWIPNPYLETDEGFDFYNKNVDGYFHYRGEYNDIHYWRYKHACGYILGKGKQGANLINIKNDKHLLPFDITNGSLTNFEPFKRVANFKLGPLEFKLNMEGKEDCDVPSLLVKIPTGQFKPIDYTKFMILVKNLTNKKMLTITKTFEDNLLKELL